MTEFRGNTKFIFNGDCVWHKQNRHEFYLEGIQYSTDEFNLKMLEKKSELLGLE